MLPSVEVHVCLMLKAPRAGSVKTRLGATIGMPEAACVYRQLVEHQITQIPADWVMHFAYTPKDALAEMKEWLGEKASYFCQCEGDLGARLQHATEVVFDSGAKRLVLLGGDCPELTTPRLQAAAAAPGIAIWPTRDGGYCLIAMDKPEPELLLNMPWSTPAIFQETMARGLEQALVMAVMSPTLEDVDHAESLQRMLNRR